MPRATGEFKCRGDSWNKKTHREVYLGKVHDEIGNHLKGDSSNNYGWPQCPICGHNKHVSLADYGMSRHLDKVLRGVR